MAITIKPKQPASRAAPAPKTLHNADMGVSVTVAKFDKRAYQRELMRQRRAADRDAGLVSVKLPADLVAKFKATGAGWQARMNDVLAAAKV